MFEVFVWGKLEFSSYLEESVDEYLNTLEPGTRYGVYRDDEIIEENEIA